MLGLDERRRRFLNREPGQLRQLGDKHREAMRLFALGKTTAEVAEILGWGLNTVSVVKNSYLGTLKRAELQSARDESIRDISDIIDEGSHLSAEYLLKWFKEGTTEFNQVRQLPSLKLKGAEFFADRSAKTAKITRRESKSISAVFTKADLDEIKLEKMKRINNNNNK